jgi:hypothetical protein
LEYGTYSVTVRATDGNAYPLNDEITFSIKIEPKLTQTSLETLVNNGRLSRPMGILDSNGDIYVVDVYNADPEDKTIVFNCTYQAFIDLWIDGVIQIRDDDFSSTSGSTIVTVYGQTLGKLDSERDHVIAAEFKEGGKPNGAQYKVAENFKINVVERVSPLPPPPSPPQPPPKPPGGTGAGDSSSGSTTPPEDNTSSKDNETINDTQPSPPPLSTTKPPAALQGGGGGGNSTPKSSTPPEDITPLNEDEAVNDPQPPSTPPSYGIIFDDVNQNDWFYEDVVWVYTEGLMIGVAQGVYAPYETVNSAMVSVTLTRMLGVDLSGYEFETDSWFSSAVAWMIDKGFFDGIDVFEPNTPLKRGQLAVVLARLMSSAEQDLTSGGWRLSNTGLDGTGSESYISGAGFGLIGREQGDGSQLDTTEDELESNGQLDVTESELESNGQQDTAVVELDVIDGEYITISDSDMMSDEEFESFTVLNKLGIIKGKGDGRMDPQGTLIRAELAAILHRVSDYITD